MLRVFEILSVRPSSSFFR
uniref:Uncharacterized protein n=1 Tax=Arundo donax TaxID=35708 RepID=A0A0A9CH01_ARUDO